MRTVTLTQIEATGIQEYIFGSNNLRQNVGASELVARATTEWVAWALDKAGCTHNASWNAARGELDLSDKGIGTPGVDAEVVYAGGGNALLLFDGPPEQRAVEFVKILTRKALNDARGLPLVVDHLRFDLDDDALGGEVGVHLRLRGLLAARKLSRPLSAPLAGLGVTAACVFTGLPAVGVDDDGRLISKPVQCKLEAVEDAKERLEIRLLNGQPHAEEYGGFAEDFDLLGESGESSYLAVIHADGNDMGKRFAAIADAFPEPRQNRAYIECLRKFSKAVEAKADGALRAAVRRLLESRDDDGLFGGVVPAPRKEGKVYLPFRPIVSGGDDVTFVCEGRLGLTLAQAYLHEVAQGALPGVPGGMPGEPLYCRAGVAVVKTHYPFSRAYDLAESLCASAKAQMDYLVAGKGSVMDWHFSTSGVILPLKQVRAREYTAASGSSLLMRPVRLNLGEKPPPGSHYWRSWETLVGVMDQFADPEGKWAGRQNKLKALQDALRQGATAVEQFRANYSVGTLPQIPDQSTMATTGWQSRDCGYFDALEALGFYVPLNGQKGRAA